MPPQVNSLSGRLSEADAALFYKLWMGLLDYVNCKFQIDNSLGKLLSPRGLDIEKLLPIRDKLWTDIVLIDEYIENEKKSLSNDEITILRGWKTAVCDKFIVMKHLKKYSVLMTSEQSPLLFGTIGIMSTWEELVPTEMLPVMIDCVLIPFRNEIIYDSFLLGGNIRFGSSYKKSFNNAYRASKELYGIIMNFDNLDETRVRRAVATSRRKRILNDVLAEVREERQMISAWHKYLENAFKFPFEAVCKKQLVRSPLEIGEQVVVANLAKVKDCGEGIAVVIEWHGRKFAVPLEQLGAADPTMYFTEALEDWKYWITADCFNY